MLRATLPPGRPANATHPRQSRRFRGPGLGPGWNRPSAAQSGDRSICDRAQGPGRRAPRKPLSQPVFRPVCGKARTPFRRFRLVIRPEGEESCGSAALRRGV